jgi:uncharacterized membrane protein (DUF4010 family)
MFHVEWTSELRFVIAIVLGFLVGLERETMSINKKQRVLAGVRTYTIVSMFGYSCAYLLKSGVWSAVPLGMATVAAMLVVGYLAKLKEGHIGWTSEISAALTFVVGALCLLAEVWVPMALAVVNTILLSEKSEIEHHVERLDTSEFLAVVKFLLVTVIILPAIPNQSFTQFALNPTRIWQIVVMVSSIGFVGYFVTKKFGNRFGLPVSGLVGGIVSSTAVTIAMGRLVQRNGDLAMSALRATLLAGAVMYLRLLVLLWILNPALLPIFGWKLSALAAVGIALMFVTPPDRGKTGNETLGSLQNPFEIRPALIFAVVFVIVSVLMVLTRNAFGDSGILALSAVVGVVNIDPYFLSIVQGGQHVEGVLLSSLFIAMMSNTVARSLYFGWMAKGVRKETAWRYGLWALLHIPAILIR